MCVPEWRMCAPAPTPHLAPLAEWVDDGMCLVGGGEWMVGGGCGRHPTPPHPSEE